MMSVMSRRMSRACVAVTLILASCGVRAEAAGPADEIAARRETVRGLPDGVVPLYVLGDLNEDGRVDREDLRILTELVAMLEKNAPRPRGLSCVAAGDVNLDGEINSADIKRLAEWLGKANEITTPAMYWKPGLPCQLARLSVASRAQARPGEEFPVMLIGSGLDVWLTRHGIRRVIVSGIRTEQCCETTTRMASDLGYDVDYVTEATLTFPMAAAHGRTFSALEIKARTELVLAGRFATVDTEPELDVELGRTAPR